ncbi:beta strand repeat-containing protein [Hymenobacter yonginensis]|uniref:Ig-like domain-containing protein n=1 Tax=Hymenobacter yonginensis TaxID=748197 RepID=A0ABY7PMQ2_9BACT|nr:LamG-like jellyroll fold domain-containing protein [Hymenobacter yonginensis]WBO84439.1 Ig-like domain-containing protein [Hymenobacter yonginensis]
MLSFYSAFRGRLLPLLAGLLLLSAGPARAQTAATRLYWVQSSTTAADDQLASSTLTGSGAAALASGNSATTFQNPSALWVDVPTSTLYVGDGAATGSTGISRFSLSGTYLNTLVAGSTAYGINAVQVVGSKVYWVQSSNTAADDKLCVINTDGTGLTVLASGAASFDNPRSLWVDAANGLIYVGDGANAATTGIRTFTLTGASPTTLVAGVPGASINGLQVAGAKLYWVQSSNTPANDQLASINLDGTNQTVLASGNSATTFANPRSLRVDVPNGAIYVGDGAVTGSTGISRFSLAGGAGSSLVAGSATVSYNGVATNEAAVAPTVTTAAAGTITGTSAVLGGNATADGGAAVSARGVVYSTTNTTPALGGTGVTQDANGTGTGNFSETITGLTAGTTYYVRAYATNSAGTSYGTVQTFSTATTVTSIVRAGTINPANASQVSFTVTFANAVSGISTSNFSVTTTGAVSGATISSLAGSGTTYTVTVNTGTGDGTLRLDLTNSTGISPTVSNVPFTGGEQYTIDKTRPAVVISSTAGASGSTTTTTPIPFTVTFAENVSGFVAGDVTVTNGSITGNVVNGTSPGTTYTFTVTPAAGGTATTVAVPANVAQDAAGNGNTAAPAAYALTYQQPTATVSSVTRLALSPTAVSTVQYRVVFSTSVTGVTVSNFSVTTTGISGASVVSTSGSGTTYTVNVNTGTGNGTLRLDVANSAGTTPTIANVPYTAGEVYTISKSFAAAPTLRIQSVGSASGNSDVTAFVDAVQVVQNGTATVVPNGLQNGSFETNNVAANTFLYQTQGVIATPWTFTGAGSGVSRNNSAFGSTAIDGGAVALLQNNDMAISQNLAVPTGNYQINFRTIQRNYTSLDQRLNVFVNDVFVGSIQPNNIPTYDTFTSASFSVTAPALTATVSSTAAATGGTTATTPIPFSVSFSQSVGTSFTATDLTVGNGSVTAGSFSGSGAGPYSFTVTPTTPGTATTVSLAAGVAQDANNTLNSASNAYSVTYVPSAPVLLAPSGTPVGLGQALTLTGSDLSSPTALTINGADALSGIISNTGSSLVVRVPVTAAASGTISLSTANGTSNSVAFQVLAAPGNALAFDGTNDVVSIPSAPALNLTTAFTIEAWINPVGTGNATQNVVCKSSQAQNTGYIFPRTDDTWASVRLWLHRGGGWSQYTIPYGPSKLGRWHHLAATYDGTTVRLYLDGEEVPNVATGSIQSGAVTTNTNPLTLGSQPGYTEFYRGKLDEVRVYNAVRTAAQIQNDMRTVPAGLPEAGLVEYLNFDQGTPATASTGNNTGLTTLYDLASAQPATLTGFALASGNTTSNYVGSLAMVVPIATAATNRQPNSFTATWTAPAVGTVTSYVLDVATNATFTAPVAGSPFTVAAPATSYTVTGLANTASTYYYRVRALAAPLADEGTFSNTITTATPLPVELTAFTATATGPQVVRLAWTTATEVNSAAFGVERSLDGVTFRTVGTVPAAGTSATPRTYSLLDQQLPAGVPVLYYRLQQLDQDGTFSYSPVRAVALSNAAPTRLTLAPNPTTGAATLRGAAAHAPVQLYDAVGRLVLTATADATGTARLVLPAGQPLGVYVVRTGAQATRLVLE